MKFRKVISASLALMLAASLPLSALAETYDLAKGSITVEAKADGNQYVSQDGGVQNEKQTTETVIEQDKSTSSTTTNTITIKAEENTTAEVTISDVDIDVRKTGDFRNQIPGEAAISTGGDGNVTIELDGDSSLKSGYDRAGLEKSNGGNLTIGDDNELDGSLTAKAGNGGGAGIGGGNGSSASDITITGGDVNAAGSGGAGIGGGRDGSGTDITIAGGNVEAIGGGAGIGGGQGGSGSNILIKDGNVEAEGGFRSSGIGGGRDGSGTDITIAGGNVKVSTSSGNGAVIGGGNNGDGSNITFKGGTTEVEMKYSDGAGIGGGYGGSGTNIAVSGDAQLLLKRKDTGIGSGPYFGSGLDGGGEIDPDISALDDNGAIFYPHVRRPSIVGSAIHAGCTAQQNEVWEQEAVAATCTQPGYILYKCQCGALIKQVIPAIPHSFTTYVTQNDATCEKDGTKVAVCDYEGCNAKRIVPDSGSKLGHARVYHEAKEATCTEKGWDAYETCKRCDYSTYVEKPIDPDNHALKHYDAKEATCTEKGWDAYDTCTRCNYSTYVEVPIDPDNHALKHHDAKEATCTEKGWEEYDTCTRCNYSTYVERPINPSNHDLEHHDGKEPTCTEDGWEEYDTCKRKDCTYTTYQKINALNHSFTKYVYQNDATCLEDGKEIAHCDHTGCTETDVRTAVGTALGHRFTDYVYNGDADYASDGTETAQCDHGCGETDTRPAEGTRLAIYWVTDEAGKTIAASESRSGSVLTITVNQESASLHGYTAGLRALQAEGIDTIVFVTNSAVSTFTLASVPTGAAYCLTHTGAEVTFTLDGADISAILQ